MQLTSLGVTTRVERESGMVLRQQRLCRHRTVTRPSHRLMSGKILTEFLPNNVLYTGRCKAPPGVEESGTEECAEGMEAQDSMG